MALPAGRKFGPYEVLAPIGAGGMGEVYKARDTRLDRIVAVKILAPSAAALPELRQRFDREARAVSSLNHPNICSLFDIGSQDGVDYLVMEFLEGETLAERIGKGPLPLDQALRYAADIASALEAAHRHGVVHRDLKPSNIILTPSGAKVLDFGLAKLQPAQHPVISGGSELQTVTSALTGDGRVVGTLQYMAPEQLEGKDADPRTDLFALGAVLYEMVTGRRAFEASSHAAVISCIMMAEPAPLSAAQPLASASLDHLVRTCMAKNPGERWSTAHDVLVQLRWMASAGSPTRAIEAGAIPRRAGRDRLGWLAAAIFFLAAAAASLAYFRRPAEQAIVRFTVNSPEGTRRLGPPIVSPDGRHVAFLLSPLTELHAQLWVRDLDSLNARLLAADTEPFSRAFWSPDSRYITFASGGNLKKLDIAGGPAQSICDIGRYLGGGSWNRDGTILFTGRGQPLFRVPAGGGVASAATALDASSGAVAHSQPQFLPDGTHFLYTAVGSGGQSLGVYVGELKSKQTRRLPVGDGPVEFVEPGYLLYFARTGLMAQPFDPSRLQTTGEPKLIVETAEATFSASANGVLAFAPSARLSNGQVVWTDRSGKEVAGISEPGVYYQPAVSPDRSTIAVDRREVQTGNTDIWLYDPARETTSRFTFGPRVNAYPVWSPDGSRLAYSSSYRERWSLAVKPANGGGEPRTLYESPQLKRCTDWSPDGRYLIYEEVNPQTRGDLWLMPLQGDHKPVPYLVTEFNETAARFSPDGKLVAYTSNESGREEVYVQTFPPGGGKWQISNAGGNRAVWRRDGKELYYIGADRRMMGVEVATAGKFSAARPRPLFDARMALSARYDVASDGRFLLVKALREDVAVPITVVLNWPAAMKP